MKKISRNNIAAAGIIALLAVAGITGASAIIAYDQELLPGSANLRQPTHMTDADLTELEKEYRHFIYEIPGAKNLKYETYLADDTVPNVKMDYRQQMIDAGFSYQSDYSDNRVVEGIPVALETYNKGPLNVAVIAITPSSSFGDENTGRTIVLYTTGSPDDYVKIYNWYKGEKR